MEDKNTVAQIIVDRLIAKIKADKRLPWQKPFVSSSMNWFSKTEYRGVNRLLLDGGEYITPNQLKQHNEKTKSNFWFKAGTPYDIVVFYSVKDYPATPEEVARVKKGAKGYVWIDGVLYRRVWILRYYRVYNIEHISTPSGEKLIPRMGNTIVEKFTPADDIANKYLKVSGVRLHHDGAGNCYYTVRDDSVHMSSLGSFHSTEGYYRVLFHELVHSTGVEKRLHRSCFTDYRERAERSREELIAEIGGLLLASEAGFREDTKLGENSDSYIVSWISWMKESVNEVVNGMLAAEKAKTYILNGVGAVLDDAESSGEVVIK